MQLLKKEYYYKVDNIIHKRVEIGTDQFKWWKYSHEHYVWQKVQSKDEIDRLESFHQKTMGLE